jgi:hypothetical protein
MPEEPGAGGEPAAGAPGVVPEPVEADVPPEELLDVTVPLPDEAPDVVATVPLVPVVVPVPLVPVVPVPAEPVPVELVPLVPVDAV